MLTSRKRLASTRGVSCLALISPLPVRVSHDDSDGVVMLLYVRRYGTSCSRTCSMVTLTVCSADKTESFVPQYHTAPQYTASCILTDRSLYRNTTPLHNKPPAAHRQTALCTAIPHRSTIHHHLHPPLYTESALLQLLRKFSRTGQPVLQ